MGILWFSRLPAAILSPVPTAYQDASGSWVGTSGRARVLAYSSQRVPEKQLPPSVWDLTSILWKEKVGWAPENASFQAFVTAMRQVKGGEKTKRWLQEMMARQKGRRYPKNSAILEGIAAGEVNVGLVNHYYLLRFKKERPDFPVEQTFFAPGDVGNLVIVAGAGILKTAKNRRNAEAFLRFLLSTESQEYFTNEVFEYPLVGSVKPHAELIGHGELLRLAPAVDLGKLRDHQKTLDLLKEVGAL